MPKSLKEAPSKSLTLKSFKYIDESKNASDESHESPTSDINIDRDRTIRHFTQDNSNTKKDISNFSYDNQKKSFKRSESFRISNSIREAISLTKKAGATSSSRFAKLSETIRDKFLNSKSKQHLKQQTSKSSTEVGTSINESDESDDLESDSESANAARQIKIVRLTPGRDGKYGLKIKEISLDPNMPKAKKSKKSKYKSIMIYDVAPNSPAATCEPRLFEGDRLVAINGVSVEGLSESKVKAMIKGTHQKQPPEIVLDIDPGCSVDCESLHSSENQSDENSHLHPRESSPSEEQQTLAQSIDQIKRDLKNLNLIKDFEKLSRKKEDESHEESRLMENIDKNRYQDILPYDSTRVPLADSMTGDYINASFVDMPVPSGNVNRYIATQGPLSSTCDDFWQMVWEQNSSIIIMVTPLIENGRVKCHKYWPDEKQDVRYGQIRIRNLCEKSRTASIDRTIELEDIKVSSSIICDKIESSHF